MNYFKRQLSHPAVLCFIVIIALVALIYAPTVDFGPFLAGGALMKALNAFVAGVVLMTLVLLARMMRVLFGDGKPEGIDGNPVAKAILFGLIYLSFAVVVASVFG